MASAEKPGYYMDGRYLGREYRDAFYNLSDDEIRRIVYSFVMGAFTQEDLAELAALNTLPEDVGFLEWAFEHLEEDAALSPSVRGIPPLEYGGLTYRSPYAAGKVSKPKASNARKPKAPARKTTTKRPTAKKTSGRR